MSAPAQTPDSGEESSLTLRIASALFEIEAREPSHSYRLVLRTLCLLVGILIVWALLARLDIVAVANGRLVPQTYVKVVQPAESGIIREILVDEGELVELGQVLVRLDPTVNAVDSTAIERELELERLRLRAVEAELADVSMQQGASDDAELFAQMDALRRSRKQSFIDAVAQEVAARQRSLNELVASREMVQKLEAMLPSYQQSAEAYEALASQRLVGELEAIEHRRNAIEIAQDLEAQRAAVASLEATVVQHDQRLAQLDSAYRNELNQLRLEGVTAITRLEQQLGRLVFQKTLLELRAPQSGVVKDLATTTVGAVVQPGTVLLNLVPQDEPLMAEVAIQNKDIGFVAIGQSVRVKLAAYQFQKYGMLDGVVRNLGADSTVEAVKYSEASASVFKALIELKAQRLRQNGLDLRLAPGMEVSVEIMQGERTVMEYLLSPVRRIVGEAGRER